jgi:hypothetical protein
MSEVQAVLFPVSKWTEWLAERWLQEHKFTPMKAVHVTDNYLRYRIHDPKKYSSFATKGTNPRLVIGFY